MRVLYIGGTGEISFACVQQAKRAGHAVTIFNRGRTPHAGLDGVEQVVGDLADAEAYAALARRDFDVVCQFLAYDVRSVDRDIDAFAGHCRQYVFISTASAYQKPCPTPLIREDTPLGNPYWAYSRAKAACEARLMAAHQDARLPVTIVRPSHTYRRRLPSPVVTGDHLVWRLMNGKPVIVPGDGESVWTVTHAEDFARAFVQLCGHPDALGEAFHIADKVGHTWNRIVTTVAKAVGAEPRICNLLSKSLVRYEPAWEGPMLGDKSNTMVFDTRKIERIAEGWRCEITLDEGVDRTWPLVAERLGAGYRPDEAVDALVDRIIADHRDGGPQ